MVSSLHARTTRGERQRERDRERETQREREFLFSCVCFCLFLIFLCTSLTDSMFLSLLSLSHPTRYGFIGRSLLQKKGTYFQYQHVHRPDGINEEDKKEGTTTTTSIKSKKSSSSSLLCLRRGDDVLFDVFIDVKTKNLRAYNVHQTKNENHVDQLKRARTEKMEQESMSRAAAATASGGGGSGGSGGRSSRLDSPFAAAPRRQFSNEEESNAERKKFLKERRDKLVQSASSSSSSTKGGRGQKTGNRQNQFGEDVETPTTSGVLLDIIGGRKEKKSNKSEGGSDSGSGSGEHGIGSGGRSSGLIEAVWRVHTSIGPDTTRGFSSEYQKSRGRLLRSLSVEAVEFVPYE